MDFILSCIGYAVGFGSVWRFPYLCYKNGGGAFLIPYVTCMVVCGVPLFFMELAIGQFSGASPLAMWDICPLFKGVGWGMLIISGLVCIYYNILLTWVVYFLALSFARRLPWSSCNNSWNTCNCTETVFEQTLENITEALMPNMTWPAKVECNATQPIHVNFSRTASYEFWRENVLRQSDGFYEFGDIRWGLLVTLTVSWLLIFACLWKGVKSVGKVVYVTATSPYILLTVLLIRNLMLPGSWQGVKYYVTPVWSKLANLEIWREAALQMFYSLGPAWGGLITLSSFNKFKNNCYRDALVLPAVNCSTAIFSGFVIFSVIGFMAHQTGKDIKDVVSQGPGLVFVAYPEAIAQMPAAPVWAVLFFLTLITIGLDSQFGMFETMTASFIDEFPRYLRKYKTPFVGVMCFLEFLLGLPFITQGGIYLFTIFDWFIGTFAVCVIALIEVLVICYVYGVGRFRADIELMLGSKPSHYWTVMWCAVTPVALVLILLSVCVNFSNPVLEDYEFPLGSLLLGWTIGCISILIIPVVAVYRICRVGRGSLLERVRHLLRPSDKWGPPKDAMYMEPIKPASKQAESDAHPTKETAEEAEEEDESKEPILG